MHNLRKGKTTLHNLVENPPGIRISTGKSGLEGESTTFMKASQSVLYQILHYSIHASERNSKYKISVTTQNFKFKYCYFNMSGDIVTQTFVPNHKMVI